MKHLTLIIVCAATANCQAQPTPRSQMQPMFSDPKKQALFERRVKAMDAGPYIVKAQKALPSQKNLPGFQLELRKDDPDTILIATRDSDKAVLKITVISTPNRDAIEGHLFGMDFFNMKGPLPQGTPSGKPLGQKAWQSYPIGATESTEQPSFEFNVQDGPSLVLMKMRAHIGQDEQGRAKWTPITQSDRLFMEQVARGIVWRLHTLKLTHDSYKPK